jgi:hypothetical protein
MNISRINLVLTVTVGDSVQVNQSEDENFLGTVRILCNSMHILLN